MEHERIIHILEYLRRNTDETRTVSIKQIQSHLDRNYNMQSVSPLTIRRDIERLTTTGYPITIKRGAHNTYLYQMETDGFTFNEIRFLVDSVSINKYLSVDQKQHLIKKFERLCSESDVRKLISRIQTNDLTPPGLNLLENLEQIHLIIANRQKIDFEYGKQEKDGMKYYYKKRNMIPCQVVFFEDRFYLKCIHAETKEPRTYRIDRMKQIQPGETVCEMPKLPKPKGAILDIFDPKYYETVTLCIKSFLTGEMKEKFGSYLHIIPGETTPEETVIRVTVGISDSFFRWLMRYGSYVELISPESLRKQFQEQLQEVAALYQKKEEESK